MRKLQKRLLNKVLTIIGRMHWHSLFFWLLERFPQLSKELAKEKVDIPKKDMDKLIKEIIRRGEWKKEAMERKREAVTPPTPEEHRVHQ